MSLDRPHLQLLAAVAEHGQLGAAARALNLSASAASHRMRDAERRSGLSLIEQKGRVVRLTAAGRHLAEAAGLFERQLVEAEAVAGLILDGRRARVRMALDFYDAASWLTELVTGSAQVPVDLVRVEAGGSLTALHHRLVDLAVIPTGVTPTGPHVSQLCDDELVAVVASSYGHSAPAGRALSPAALAGQPYLATGFDPQEGFEFREFFAPAACAPTRITRIESLRMVLSLVAAGHGVSIQPHRALPITDGVDVRPLDSRPIEVRWIACTLGTPSAELTTIIEWVRSALDH